MHNVAKALCLAAALMFVPAASSAQGTPAPRPATLTLKGPAGTQTLSAADIAAMPHVELRITIHDKPHVFSGVPLNRLLPRVGAPSGEALHGKALTHAVIVHSRDEYVVVLALAETDPTFRDDPVILADRVDGKALDDTDGPFRLVMPNDLRPARSARMVDRIEVRALESR